MPESFEVQARIRPPRITVLTSTNTTHSEFIHVVQFLSMVYGGKYARFIYADLSSSDFVDYLRKESSNYLPELLILASQKDNDITRFITSVSRPELLNIPSNFIDDFSEHATGGLLPWYRIIREEHKLRPGFKRDNLFILNVNASEEYLPLVAATYGYLSRDLSSLIQKSLRAKEHEISITTTGELHSLNFLMSDRVSWLDFLNREIRLISSAFYPPTIVLVSQTNEIRDLGIYWNIKNHIAPPGQDESILLLRESDICNKEALKSLARTLANSKIGSNYCHVYANPDIDSVLIKRVVNSLRARLRAVKGNDYFVDTPKNLDATSYPYTHTTNTTISKDRSIISIPRIEFNYESQSSSARWYIDLVKDISTNRYPFELALQKNTISHDLLNIPAGSFMSFSRILSLGNECMSILFSGGENRSNTRFQIPSNQEIFETLLDSAGWRLLFDEKNTRYTQFLNLFDSIYQASTVLVGRSWKMLDALANEPLTNDKLRGKAKLGRRNKSEPLPELAHIARNSYTGISGAIFERRIRTELSAEISKNTPDDNILDFLVSHRVILRKWLLDKCPRCNNSYWTNSIDITTELSCPGCNTHIPFKDSVKVGYEMNPLVKLSLDEGVRPVILTARFIKNLTSHGCISYLGSKLERDNNKTDIDLLIIADGKLVVGECKNLDKSMGSRNPVWKNLSNQLIQPINIAKELGADVFFVSSLVEEYPKSFQRKLKMLVGNSMNLLLLRSEDLILGRKEYIDIDGHKHTLSLHDLLNIKSRISRRKKKKNTRSMWF